MPLTPGQAAMFIAIALLCYVNNMHAMVMCNEFRTSQAKVGWILIATGAVFVAVHWIFLRLGFDRVTLPPHQIIGFIVVLSIATGPLTNKVYFLSMTALFTNFFMIFASYMAEWTVGYRTVAYYIAYPAFVCTLFALYSFSVHRYGVLLRARLVSNISSPILGVFALIALVSWQLQQRMYITRENIALPMPISSNPGLMVLPFFLTVSIAALSVIFFFVQLRARDQLEIRLAQSAINAGQNYYGKLARMSDDIRAMRHDYQYHLAVLDKLLASGDDQRAEQYLDGLVRANEEAEIKLYCKSQTINALLDSCESRCVEEAIKFAAQIDLPDSEMSVEYELCIIIGNLLENAIAGCQKTQDGEQRFINLIIRPHGSQYGITVQNSFDGTIPNARPGTEDGGGLGIQSICAIAKRNGGEYYQAPEDHVFTAYVVMQLAGQGH